MANVKISALPAATLPLAGTEAVPIVQSGVTAQAPSGEFGQFTNGFPVGYLDVPQNLVNDDYTFVLSDRGKHVYTNAEVGTPLFWTVPANADVEFPTGTVITVVNRSDSDLTIDRTSPAELFLAASGGVGTLTVTTFGMITLLKIEEDMWIINGVGVS